MEAILSSETFEVATFFHAIFPCIFSVPEDGGDIFLRKVGWLSTDCTALYPKR
jgi:hypothetical protein